MHRIIYACVKLFFFTEIAQSDRVASSLALNVPSRSLECITLWITNTDFESKHKYAYTV